MTLSIAFSWISLLIIPAFSGSASVGDPVEHSSWFSGAGARIASGEYRFSPQVGAENTWSAPNRANEFRARVSARGAHVEPRTSSTAGDSWQLELSTRAFGRADGNVALDGAVLRADGPRVELDHGPLVEWFVNDERGLEHGWTIARPPPGAGPVWIGLDIGGDLELRIDAGGRSGAFVDASGDTQLRYTGLAAFDATGCELDARLIPSPAGLGIVIDDQNAKYPLAVDPVLTGPACVLESDQGFARFASVVASAGDVNGDGFSDVVVGAFGYDNGESEEGRAFVYTGSSAGLSQDFSWTAESGQPGSEFAASVASAGDVNGDGYSDVIVGAPKFDGVPDEGLAFVYHGSSTGLSPAVAWSGQSNSAGAKFGSSIASAGDVNGDGYSDVIIGAPTAGPFVTGRAYVYHGSEHGVTAQAAWMVSAPLSNSVFGASVASAGDVNGDGYSDVIVGASHYDGAMHDTNPAFDEGAAFVYLGSPVGLATSPAWSAESGQGQAFFGISVASAGDVNGDGFSDVIVGANSYEDGEFAEGAAFVYLGSSNGLSATSDWSADGDEVNASFGRSVASAGDANGDGYSDVIVGAFGAGRSEVYLGSSTGLATSPAWTIDGGRFVASAGDANGDGFGDVLVLSSDNRANLFLGNEGRGSWTLTPQQRQASDVRAIQLLGRSSDNLEFRIHLAFGRTLAGFEWASGIAAVARLEWEVEPLSAPLDGNNVHASGSLAIDGSLLRFNEIVSFPDDGAPPPMGVGHHVPARSQPFHWRARIRTNNPLLPVTPWVTIAGSNVTETKLRAGSMRGLR